MVTEEIKIPAPEALKAEIPLQDAERALVMRRREEIERVLMGASDRMLFLVGPCSAHEEKSVLEFAEKLADVGEQVKDRLVLILRVFTSKPRTKGVGYKGMISRPDPDGREDYRAGLAAARRLHRAVLSASGLAAADEMLFPEEFSYFDDLVGYAVIGARTSESPLHRMTASGLEMPVGVKNPMSGSLPALVNSIEAIKSEQCYLCRGCQVRTSGNRFAHGILRGRVDETGKDVPNYSQKTLEALFELFQEAGEENPAVLIDCNHSNSGKRAERQPEIVKEVLSYRKKDAVMGKFCKGFLTESFLLGGADPSGREYGKSITDPCLSFEETKRLIFSVAETL